MTNQMQTDDGSTGQNIVAEARKWIGTPYVHQASLIGVGTDCLGLVRGVWRALYGDEPQPVPPYSPDWGEIGHDEPLLSAAREHLDEITVAADRPGSLLIFRMRPNACAKHCAFLANDDRMVHAWSGHAVCEVPYSLSWKRRLAAAFRFPLIAEVS